MTNLLLNIYNAGNVVGYVSCIFFMLVMTVATVYVMKKYLN